MTLELFPLDMVWEDQFFRITNAIRQAIRGRDLSLKLVSEMAIVCHSMERLPESTNGINCELLVASEFESGRSSLGLHLDEELLTLYTVEASFESTGTEHVIEDILRVYLGDPLNTEDPEHALMTLEMWVNRFESDIMDTDCDLEVMMFDSEVDWSINLDSRLWEGLDSAW